MMGERPVMQEALFYEFSLERHVPADHLLRSIDRFVDLSDLRLHLRPFYSEIGRPSIDPELMIRMLIVGYCFGIRSERRLCEEVHLNIGYRWFCRLDLEGGARPLHLLEEPAWPLPRQRSPARVVRDDGAPLHRGRPGRWRRLRGRRQSDPGRRHGSPVKLIDGAVNGQTRISCAINFTMRFKYHFLTGGDLRAIKGGCEICRIMKFLALDGEPVSLLAKGSNKVEETMKRVAMTAAGTIALAFASVGVASAESKFQCEPGETYVMNVMVSAHPYWVPVYQGFKQAAEAMGCETVFSGTRTTTSPSRSLPSSRIWSRSRRASCCIRCSPTPSSNRSTRRSRAASHVVTFAADSPKSKRTGYMTSDNLAEAKFAAEEIVKQVGDSAEYAVLENPGQTNHDLRVTALIAYMEKNYPEHEAGGPPGDQPGHQRRLQGHRLDSAGQPEAGGPVDSRGRLGGRRGHGSHGGQGKVLIMHADVTPTTLEHIKAGNIHMALNPNQGMQGFMGFLATFLAAHPDMFDPFNDYKVSGYNPMQIPFIDNGFAVITKENADSFDLNIYMKGRDPS